MDDGSESKDGSSRSSSEVVWGTDLWDQVDSLSTYTAHGIDLLDRFGRLLKGRARLETEYAKGLRRLLKQCVGSSSNANHDLQFEHFTTVTAFKSVLQDMSEMAMHHESLAATWNQEASETIDKEVEKARRQKKDSLKKIRRQEKALEEDERELKKYVELSVATDLDAKFAIRRHQDALGAKKQSEPEIERTKANAQVRSKAAKEAEYSLRIALYNSRNRRETHFNSQLPAELEKLREVDGNRITFLVQAIERAVQSEKATDQELGRCLTQIENHAGRICRKKDAQSAADMFRSGRLPPIEPGINQSSEASENGTSSSLSDAESNHTAVGKFVKMAKGIFGGRERDRTDPAETPASSGSSDDGSSKLGKVDYTTSPTLDVSDPHPPSPGDTNPYLDEDSDAKYVELGDHNPVSIPVGDDSPYLSIEAQDVDEPADLRAKAAFQSEVD